VQLTYQPLEIIVVDNCSADGTQNMVRSEFPGVVYIRSPENIGAGARNLGIRNAKAELVVTLDDDIFGLDDGDLERIVRYFRERVSFGVVNFKIVDHVRNKICNWVHHCNPEEYQDKEFQTYEITEGAAAFRKQAVEQAGYYPEGFFLSYEGPDLAFRIMDIGYEVIYSGNISVVHRHSDLGRKPWFNYYYDTRNQFWLAARNLPAIYGSVFLSRGLFSMLVYSIRDGFLRFYIKGIVDGLKGLGRAFKSRKPLSTGTMRVIKAIDRKRPGLQYYITQRLLRRGARL